MRHDGHLCASTEIVLLSVKLDGNVVLGTRRENQPADEKQGSSSQDNKTASKASPDYRRERGGLHRQGDFSSSSAKLPQDDPAARHFFPFPNNCTLEIDACPPFSAQFPNV